MTFWDWLEKIRQRSESSRRRMVFFLTLLAMSVIVAVWLTFFMNLEQKTSGTVYEKSPFGMIKDWITPDK